MTYLSSKGLHKVEKSESINAHRIPGVPQSYTGYKTTLAEITKITVADISETFRDLTNIASSKALGSP